jgi:hypothetical protein
MYISQFLWFRKSRLHSCYFSLLPVLWKVLLTLFSQCLINFLSERNYIRLFLGFQWPYGLIFRNWVPFSHFVSSQINLWSNQRSFWVSNLLISYWEIYSVFWSKFYQFFLQLQHFLLKPSAWKASQISFCH